MNPTSATPESADGWRQRLQELVKEAAKPEHKYGHQPRLYALTRAIALASVSALAYDEDVVFAAAYLHDLGVFLGHRPVELAALPSWDHVAYACQHAPGLLARCGFPQTKTAAVLRCIEEHQPKDQPTTLEATLLRDADILEQLGAVGVLRTAAKLGSDTRFVRFGDAYAALMLAAERLPTQLWLPAARALAEVRLTAMRAFCASLASESGDDLH